MVTSNSRDEGRREGLYAHTRYSPLPSIRALFFTLSLCRSLARSLAHPPSPCLFLFLFLPLSPSFSLYLSLSMEQFIYIIPSVGFTVCFDRNSIIKCPGYLMLDTPNIHNTPFPYAWQLIPPMTAHPPLRSNGQSNMTIHREEIKN